MSKNKHLVFTLPYILWLALFVTAPLVLIFYQSFLNINGHPTWENYRDYIHSATYLQMTFNSVWYALVITGITLVVAYPVAYVIAQLRSKDFWLALVILPTWINLLLKTYAFIGLLGNMDLLITFCVLLG